MKQIKLLNLKKEFSFLKKKMLVHFIRVMSEGRFILGSELEEFEKKFATYCNVNYTVGVSDGTSAIFLALKALGIKEGDEVITTAMTFNATAEAISQNGAKPVFVDINPNTLSIDPKNIANAITSKTKAILPVHLYGIPAPMDEIMKIARQKNLFVVEDCAQAHGSTYKGKKMGTFGDIGAYSFMPAKNLGSYGDAGAIVTNKKEYADHIKKLRNHGRTTKYVHDMLGYNKRMDNLQAVVLLEKLPYLDRWNKKRREIALYYDTKLNSNIKKIKAPFETESNYYTYTILVKNRTNLMKKLAKVGIETGIYYPLPLHLQPMYHYLNYKKGDLPIVEKASDEVLSLPVHPFLSDREISKVIRMVNMYA
jgi:dTDP-4-amino-4,6-dideoxygalactose transaminase